MIEALDFEKGKIFCASITSSTLAKLDSIC